MTDKPTPKRMGRPPLPEGQARTGRLSMRVAPDVEAKAKRVGTPAVEAAIRRIKEPEDHSAIKQAAAKVTAKTARKRKKESE